MGNLPVYISIVLMLTTFLAVFLFYKANNHSKLSVIVLMLWLAIQSVLSLQGFYTVTDNVPPRFTFLIVPPLIFAIALFLSAKGRRYIDKLDHGFLILLHIVRLPVEIVLFWLFQQKMIPELMTFEGRNFDILSGLTAPLIFYFGFIKRSLHRNIILLWNLICLGLLINIVMHAIFSAPFPFQKLAFDQPNIAVLYFPFIWLPCCIVPLVLLSHLSSIRLLIKKKTQTQTTHQFVKKPQSAP
jgi:hypothetical protein